MPYTTDYTKNVIYKRTSYIQTKHHVKFHYFISVRTCYKPGGGMCRCEGYGFRAVYSRIGYINQSKSRIGYHFSGN